MKAYDAMNLWSTNLIYVEDGEKKKLYRLPSGDVHLFLMKYGYQIKYSYIESGWLMNGELSAFEISELKNRKTKLRKKKMVVPEYYSSRYCYYFFNSQHLHPDYEWSPSPIENNVKIINENLNLKHKLRIRK